MSYDQTNPEARMPQHAQYPIDLIEKLERERDALKADVNAMRTNSAAIIRKMADQINAAIDERDALQSRLAAMTSDEAVERAYQSMRNSFICDDRLRIKAALKAAAEGQSK